MLRHELLITLKNRKVIVIYVILFFIVMYDLSLNCWDAFGSMGMKNRFDYSNLNILPHPANASFLSATSIGGIGYMLFLWLLPVYFLIMYCGNTLKETKSGYFSIVMAKVGKKKYLKTKYAFSFMLGFMIMFSLLIVNYLSAVYIFYGGKSFGGLQISYYPNHFVFTNSLTHPYIAYFIYIIVASLISGGCMLICTGISFIVTKATYLYLSCFLLWYLQIIAPNSITFVLQPFIEYDLPYIIPAVITFGIMVLAVVVYGYYYRLYREEI